MILGFKCLFYRLFLWPDVWFIDDFWGQMFGLHMMTDLNNNKLSYHRLCYHRPLRSNKTEVYIGLKCEKSFSYNQNK